MTNLRFADDLVIVAASPSKLKKMLADMIDVARTRGLEIHPGKTKILSNVRRQKGRPKGFTEVSGMKIEILSAHSGVKYLGRMFSFVDTTATEIDNRIATAWKKFGIWKTELTEKSFPLKQRMRLFDSVVLSAVLYGSCTWTMTVQLETKVRTAQRRMLRMILGHGRRKKDNSMEAEDEEDALEPWVDWIRRVTKEAESKMTDLGIEEWTAKIRRQKWKWAAKLAHMDDSRWARVAAEWDPGLRRNAVRKVGRPKRRWEEDITKLLRDKGVEGSWLEFRSWPALENDFVYRHI